MADPLNIGAVRIDETRFKKMTAQEIIKEESKGEEVPAEILAWAEQMAAFSKIPDNVTYEKVDGDVGLDALEKLGIADEDIAKPEVQNAEAPTATEQPDAVKDPALINGEEEVDNENIFINNAIPGQAADKAATEEDDETDSAEKELSLADPALSTDPEEIRKRKERKGILP